MHIPQFPPSLIVTWRVSFRRSSQSIRITSRDLLSLVACRIILAYTLTYCSVDDAFAIVSALGKGSLMAKIDLQNAFRLIPVRLED